MLPYSVLWNYALTLSQPDTHIGSLPSIFFTWPCTQLAVFNIYYSSSHFTVLQMLSLLFRILTPCAFTWLNPFDISDPTWRKDSTSKNFVLNPIEAQISLSNIYITHSTPCYSMCLGCDFTFIIIPRYRKLSSSQCLQHITLFYTIGDTWNLIIEFLHTEIICVLVYSVFLFLAGETDLRP